MSRVLNILPDVREMSVSDLADAALRVEGYLEVQGRSTRTIEKLQERRQAYLDELVTRGALDSYSFV
jgi:hypothetical protein